MLSQGHRQGARGQRRERGGRGWEGPGDAMKAGRRGVRRGAAMGSRYGESLWEGRARLPGRRTGREGARDLAARGMQESASAPHRTLRATAALKRASQGPREGELCRKAERRLGLLEGDGLPSNHDRAGDGRPFRAGTRRTDIMPRAPRLAGRHHADGPVHHDTIFLSFRGMPAPCSSRSPLPVLCHRNCTPSDKTAPSMMTLPARSLPAQSRYCTSSSARPLPPQRARIAP